MKLLNPPPHNQALPSHVNCKCAFHTGPHKHAVVSGSHTHNISDVSGYQSSILKGSKDFALFLLHNKSIVYLVEGASYNHYESEVSLTVEETIEYITEMLAKVVVGVDINMFVEGVKQELIDVINLKLEDLNLIEGEKE